MITHVNTAGGHRNKIALGIGRNTVLQFGPDSDEMLVIALLLTFLCSVLNIET